jgi:competence transcription factor ComK
MSEKITYANKTTDKPVAIFVAEAEDDNRMKCIWIDTEAIEELKRWSMNRMYRKISFGSDEVKDISVRATTPDEELAIEFDKKMGEDK